MSSLKDIVQNQKGKAGSAQSWEVVVEGVDIHGVEVCELWHYNTRMLRWRRIIPSDPDYLDYSTGHGSVSDQNGMNIAFRALGLPYRYDRDIKGGGARITELSL